jgi:hypothetical protein
MLPDDGFGRAGAHKKGEKDHHTGHDGANHTAFFRILGGRPHIT